MSQSLLHRRRRTSPLSSVWEPPLALDQNNKALTVSTALARVPLTYVHLNPGWCWSIALKADDIQTLKAKFGFNPDEKFAIPKDTYDAYAAIAARGAKLESEWNTLLSSYAKRFPNEHAELTRRISGKLPDNWEKLLPTYKVSDAAQASRKLSELVLTALTPNLPELIGGSADLTPSNLTKVKATTDFQPENTGLGTYRGTYIRFGVREHAMGAIANGLHAYGAIVPFVATFLVSSVRKIERNRPLSR